jgi:hypothetical protein
MADYSSGSTSTSGRLVSRAVGSKNRARLSGQALLRGRVGIVVCLLVAWAFAGAVLIPETEARKPVSVHCSPSGDLCQGVFRYKGRIKFSLGLAARYYSRVYVCVRNPAGRSTCRGVRVRQRGGYYEALIAFAKNFPSSRRGKYKVTWVDYGYGYRIGRPLYFRKR